RPNKPTASRTTSLPGSSNRWAASPDFSWIPAGAAKPAHCSTTSSALMSASARLSQLFEGPSASDRPRERAERSELFPRWLLPQFRSLSSNKKRHRIPIPCRSSDCPRTLWRRAVVPVIAAVQWSGRIGKHFVVGDIVGVHAVDTVCDADDE